MALVKGFGDREFKGTGKSQDLAIPNIEEVLPCPPEHPQNAINWSGEALSSGDIDAALALYESTATFAPEIGKSVSGLAAIREVLKGFTATNPTLTVDVPFVLESGDIALLHSAWTLNGTGDDGQPVNIEGKGIEVVRRQADGTWKFVIDNPNGSP